MMATAVDAHSVSMKSEWKKLLRVNEDIQPLGPNAFGELFRGAAGRFTYFIAITLLAVCANSSVAAETVTYYYTSPQGTVLATTDAAGNVLSTADYRPYGVQVLGVPGAGPGYTGHVNDPDSGLVYMQARYYDSSSGRFLSIDPAGFTAGDVFSFSRYAYANSNPVTNIDPDGRTVTCGADTCTIDSHSLFEVVVDYATVGVIYTQRLIHNATNPVPTSPIVHQEHHEDSPALPDGLVGKDDSKSRQQGGRVNSGPLAPEHGGTGDSAKDFDKLTGGKSSPAPKEKGYPEGTRVGENGISHRPATEKSGPRIDIPATGSKPHETLHYPKPDVTIP
jgi:RHS repeat-associated protein